MIQSNYINEEKEAKTKSFYLNFIYMILRNKGNLLLPKTPLLYTGAELNLRDRVLGEVEKDSFIALPGKGGHRGLLP